MQNVTCEDQKNMCLIRAWQIKKSKRKKNHHVYQIYLAISGKSNWTHFGALVGVERVETSVGHGVPELHCAIGASAREVLTVWRKSGENEMVIVYINIFTIW